MSGPILVTGCAGFIGMHCAERLLARGETVVGIDNLNAYYDPALKEARLARLTPHPRFSFERLDVANRAGLAALFARVRPVRVLHLAAQAGVRYSLEQPDDYTDSNLLGFANILQGCRTQGVAHLVFASSSSVYGGNAKLPFCERDAVDHPISYYAATKKANEVMAHTYAHLYGLPTTGLRFFTVYGPWMRPDMVPFVFAERAASGLPIKVFNEGRMQRDFTYIDDIVGGIRGVMDRPPEAGTDLPQGGRTPFRLYNIGNNQPAELLHVIACLERSLGMTIEREMAPMQPGDVPATYADIDDFTRATGFLPETSIEDGIEHFARWFRDVWMPIRSSG